MNHRQIGIIILVIGIVLSGSIFLFKAQTDQQMHTYMEETGSCITTEGKCLHQQQTSTYIIAWAFSLSLIILGTYLLFFDKTYSLFLQQQRHLIKELEEAKQKDEFTAYLPGFSDEERQVIKAVHEQEGIKQSTLHYRTGISKSSLSLLLRSLEEKDVIKRRVSGKTKEVYLRKKF